MPPPVRRRVTPTRRGRVRSSFWRTLGRVVAGLAGAGFAFIGYLYLTLPDVRPLADTPPDETAFMRLRDDEAHDKGTPARRAYQWVRYDRIALTLKRAVLVAEDDLFWQHEGVDLDQIREAIEDRLSRGEPLRGGSTITQQLAKNLYLSPSRSPIRKLRELMITRLLERLLTKRRILELYLNVIEWGDGVWGAEAASRRYFRKSAAQLSASEAALLAGAIINPVRYSPAAPPRRLRNRQQMILRRMGSSAAPRPPADRDERPAQPSMPAAPTAPDAIDAPTPSPADAAPKTDGRLEEASPP